ncbi:hypothetical protein GTY65_01770 [Streptomyces sp. SID8379]|uniref:hypothetical protein n=1 Tax=unclassified Streptomyces TaxID=2593676 RepID=UPI00036F8304|nr:MULTISPECIES: hypothetical protein [unclassified Streptomyces]MYW62812.1 hypothetical protein [Streptomyces sp. SID8379]
MALVPWDIHLKAGQLAAFAGLLTTLLVTSVRRRPRTATAQAPAPPPPTSYRVPVVPSHPLPIDPTHGAAVTDLHTCVAELASDLAKRYGGEV